MALIEPNSVTLKNNKTVCIRNRTMEEAALMRRYMEVVFRDDRYFLTTGEEIREWLTEEQYLKRTKEFNEHEQKLLIVTEADGQLISLTDIECGQRQRNRHVGQIGMSVHPAYRGIGLGTAIMEILIHWAQINPVIEKLVLGVFVDNEPAIRLYRKMGFREEGRKIREIKHADGTYVDWLCMYRFVEAK